MLCDFSLKYPHSLVYVVQLQMMAVFCKVVKTLEKGAKVEEVGHWGWIQKVMFIPGPSL